MPPPKMNSDHYDYQLAKKESADLYIPRSDTNYPLDLKLIIQLVSYCARVDHNDPELIQKAGYFYGDENDQISNK